ncbi:MAG: GGDEF domain-containing protein [Lachnospiraceae bacterium]|nr:GGDEF domain-containing protein [Lachnospiraceae bacterium]
MQEQKFIKTMRLTKIIQLIILVGIELAFIIMLIANGDLHRQIYSNKALFFLSFVTWLLAIFNLCCLLYDFFKMRTFALESHALNKTAYLDSLTGMPNRHSLDTVFQTYTTPDSLTHTGCAMFTISNLKKLNETFGREAGDNAIQDFCNIFEEIGDNYGFVGRNGGNDFIAVINNCNHDTVNHFLAVINNRLSLYNAEHPDRPIEICSAYTLYDEAQVKAFTQLLAVTYDKLHTTAV